MRLNRTLTIATLLASGLGLVPGPAGTAFAASREMQELQRDVAQLQDQVRTLQSGFDQKMAALQVLVTQALDAANKANTTVSVLSAGVSETLNRELKQSMTPVAGLSTKLDTVGSEVNEVRGAVSDLNSQINRIQAQLTDVNNALKVLQAPPAAPPPAAGAAPGASTMPPVPAATLYENARRDELGGKLDLALSEYQDFLKFYADDPNAASAQFNIGQVYYLQAKLDMSVQAFDAVIERYPDNKLTQDAYFMKGMSLKQASKKTDAAATFRALILKYPRSDKAGQAQEQLRAMGFNVAAPAAPARRKK